MQRPEVSLCTRQSMQQSVWTVWPVLHIRSNLARHQKCLISIVGQCCLHHFIYLFIIYFLNDQRWGNRKVAAGQTPTCLSDTSWMHPCTHTVNLGQSLCRCHPPPLTTCMLGGSNHTTHLPISPQQPRLIGFIPSDIFNQQTAKRQSRSKSAAGGRWLALLLSSCWRCVVLTISSSIFSKRNVDKWTLFEYLWAARPR